LLARLEESPRGGLPALAEARILEFNTQVRPAFPDNLPAIRFDREQRTLRVNGLYRHGFLLTPTVVEALMPWAAPIGTGQGPRNPRALRELRRRAPQIPLIIDAGIGLPARACKVMEWGFDGALLNTAVSRSLDPIRMARAFSSAVSAGRSAFLAGPMAVQELAVSSTPVIGRPFVSDSSRLLSLTVSEPPVGTLVP
jgi:hypothetical protein